MHRILFICFGNISRSPMAEFMMKDLVKKRKQEAAFIIESRATSTEELGNPVHPGTCEQLRLHGIGCDGKVSQRLTAEDYGRFDLLIAMDRQNVRDIGRMLGGDPQGKVHTMMEHTPQGGEVADPWYTRRFDVTYQDVRQGCIAWLDRLTEK